MATPSPWARPSDVRDRWIGDPPEVTDAQLETLIADTEDTILREFPDLPERIDADPSTVPNALPIARVKKVVARIVMRHVRNPEGLRQTQEGAGPYQRSTTYGGNEPGSVFLTAEDRAELGGSLTGAAFTVDQTPTVAPRGPEGWLELGRTWA